MSIFLFIRGLANTLGNSFLISRREVCQRCYVTQQDGAHMESVDKLRSVFIVTVARYIIVCRELCPGVKIDRAMDQRVLC
jgi:hypothetical protein